MAKILTFFLALVLLAAATVSADDWAFYRGDPGATGTVSPPKAGAGQGEAKENAAVGGDWTGMEIVWEKSFENNYFEAAPIVVGDTVYIGSAYDHFYALDVKDGTQRWKFDVTEQYGVFAPATYVKDALPEDVAPRDLLCFGDDKGVVYALDPQTGKPHWSFDTGGRIHAAPNVHDERLFIGSESSTLYCLDVRTGKTLWQYKTDDMIYSFATLAAEEHRIFVAGCDGFLHVVDSRDGKSVRKIALDSPTGSTPALRGDRVYFGTEGNEFLAVDWKKGEIAWRFPVKQAFRAPAAVDSSGIVCGGHDRNVYALDAENGKEIWRFATRRVIDAGPVIVGNRVLVASNDATLTLLDRKTGRKLAALELDGGIKGSPAVVGDSVYVGTLEGGFYRVKLK